MIFALIAALVAVNILYVFLLDRKDRRHDRQINRLLLWKHEPAQAAHEDAPRLEGPLYVPDDDRSWLLNQDGERG